MSKFDTIRPYYDSEVNQALREVMHHPMMKAIMNFTFPDMPDEEWKKQLSRTHSIRDFQVNFIYESVKKVLQKSSEGMTCNGFENLEPNTSYFFISNHRDIILDTSLLNVCLHDHGLVMTASAIGDNLVKKPFLQKLSQLNRNFLVQRSLSPRELLMSSKLLSEYIGKLLLYENRSVWIAQREGRTKDGNDYTQQGVLKMIGMNAHETSLMQYFKGLRIVPMSISYEYDPTDALKIPQMMALLNNETYIKDKNEDFITLLSGIMGPKKRIHISVGKPLSYELDEIENQFDNSQKQIQALAQVLDSAIIAQYKLWPTNYIAYDLLHNESTFEKEYSTDEKQLFLRRLEKRIDVENTTQREGFLRMYANPVVNKKEAGLL